MTDEHKQSRLSGEGMDWTEIVKENNLEQIARKIATIMGQQAYEDAINQKIRPMSVFAQEYLTEFMHQVVLPEPDDPENIEQGLQTILVPMASNPLGGFELNGKKIPREITVNYCIHKKSNLHVPCNKRTRSRDYEKKEMTFCRNEITMIMRLNLYFEALSPELQEQWFEEITENYERGRKDELDS
tara:strand:+ start:1930 stop:2487 length:558 start_codon:yes stop_codon:yes gene_type:complete